MRGPKNKINIFLEFFCFFEQLYHMIFRHPNVHCILNFQNMMLNTGGIIFGVYCFKTNWWDEISTWKAKHKLNHYRSHAFFTVTILHWWNLIYRSTVVTAGLMPSFSYNVTLVKLIYGSIVFLTGVTENFFYFCEIFSYSSFSLISLLLFFLFSFFFFWWGGGLICVQQNIRSRVLLIRLNTTKMSFTFLWTKNK